MALKIPTPVSTVRPARGTGMSFRSISVPNLAPTFGISQESTANAAALMNISETGQRLAQQIDADRKEAETLSLITTQNTGDAAALKIMNGEAQKLGQHSLGAAVRAKVELETIENELREGAGDLTRSGKIAFERYLLNLRNQVLGSVTTHERTQRRAFTIEQIEVSISNTVVAGVNNAWDSGLMNSDIMLLAQRTKSLSEMTMVPDSKEQKELAEKLFRENASKMYEGAINRALDSPDRPLAGAERAKQLFNEAKAAGLLSVDALQRTEAAVNIMVMDAVARAEGMKLFETHGQDSGAAIEAVIAREDISDKLKDAIRDRYEFERNYAEAAKDRAYQDRFDSLLIKATLGDGTGGVTKNDLKDLEGDDQRTVIAEMRHWANHLANPILVSDRAVMKTWNGMDFVARGKLSYDAFLTGYANKFSALPGAGGGASDRDIAIEAWRSARKELGSASLVADKHFAKLERSAIKDAATRAAKLFEQTLDTRKVILWPKVKHDDEEVTGNRAAFMEAARQEFYERHSPENPLTDKQWKEIIDDVGSRIMIGGKALGVYQAMSDVRLWGDDSANNLALKGVGLDSGRLDVIFAFIEPRDRFEVIRWYRRATGTTPDVEVDENHFHNWVLKNINLKQTLSPKVKAWVNTALENLGVAINVENQQNYYMRWMIHTNGGIN
jgi:hypothetical protein